MPKPSKPAYDPWDVTQLEAKAGASAVKDARKVLTKGGFGTVEPRADGQGWWVICQGLTGAYEVSVRRGPRGGIESRCTCPSYKKPCKHALALLIYLAEHPEARPEAAEPAAKATADFESLLRAAFATPDDDTARLVLADYLEENDQRDRAALIRVQCAVARAADTDPGWRELVEEEGRLLVAVRKQIGKMPKGFEGDFVRGFLRLTLSYSKFKKVADLPARVVELFRDGWVESLRPLSWLQEDMIPLFRLVGTLDLARCLLLNDGVDVLVRVLRPNDPETRTRVVKPASGNVAYYRELTGGGATTS